MEDSGEQQVIKREMSGLVLPGVARGDGSAGRLEPRVEFAVDHTIASFRLRGKATNCAARRPVQRYLRRRDL